MRGGVAAERRPGLAAVLARRAVLLATALVVGLVYRTNPAFLSAEELQTLALVAAPLGVVSLGETLVLQVGEFDLSLASYIGLGVTVVRSADSCSALGLTAGILLAMALCAIGGLLNGTLVHICGMPSFVVTLAVGGVVAGLVGSGAVAWLVRQLGASPPGARRCGSPTWATATVAGVPLAFVAFGCLVACVGCATNLSVWGADARTVRARGESSRSRMVPIFRVKLVAFLTAGLLAGCAAAIVASAGSATSNYMLETLLCAYLGLASRGTGEFHAFGTALGCLLVSVLVSGMTFTAVPYQLQALCMGALLVVALSIGGAVLPPRVPDAPYS